MLKQFFKRTWKRLIGALVMVLVPVMLFVSLASEVRERETLAVDEHILTAINTISSPVLDAAIVAVTQLGGVVGVLVIGAGVVALLWRRHMRRMAVLLVSGVGGAAAINLVLKAFFQRDRPALWERLVTENSYSFPSGHAMASSALALSLMVIFWPTRWRWWVVAGGVLYMVVVGFTRLYLGVHYPTDILAGWIVSAAWVAAVVIALRYKSWFKTEARKLPSS